MSLKIKWLGTACFQIILPCDIHIVLDPFMDDSVNCAITSDIIGRCDYIFLTHGHFDHVLDVGKLASRFAPPIYCNAATAETLVEHQGVDPALIHRITAGDEVDRPGFNGTDNGCMLPAPTLIARSLLRPKRQTQLLLCSSVCPPTKCGVSSNKLPTLPLHPDVRQSSHNTTIPFIRGHP